MPASLLSGDGRMPSRLDERCGLPSFWVFSCLPVLGLDPTHKLSDRLWDGGMEDNETMRLGDNQTRSLGDWETKNAALLIDDELVDRVFRLLQGRSGKHYSTPSNAILRQRGGVS